MTRCSILGNNNELIALTIIFIFSKKSITEYTNYYFLIISRLFILIISRDGNRWCVPNYYQ